MISWKVICLLALLTLMVAAILLALFNKYLPKWACTTMHWHLAPKEQGFDGCSRNGTCPRCDKQVMQDSQGNWF